MCIMLGACLRDTTSDILLLNSLYGLFEKVSFPISRLKESTVDFCSQRNFLP